MDPARKAGSLRSMARHSHWHNIQLKKGKADKSRAGVFSKLAKNITVAAKDGGGDPTFNFKLRMMIEAAKAANMPKDNIQRAVERGTGGGDGAVPEEVIYEGFAPGGTALMVVCLTDNRNRTVAEVKTAASKGGGSIGAVGSVAWLFQKKGVVTIGDASVIKDRDAFDLSVIDAGADDIRMEGEALVVLCESNALAKVSAAVEAAGGKADSATFEFIAKDGVVVEDADVKAKLDALVETLEDLDDVDAVFTNEA
jgi:YebC/PmpR family DNA-binding regulatory protein